MGKSENIECAFPHLGTFSKFCWNKLYLLGCLYIVYNIVDIWTLCRVTKKYTGHCMWLKVMLINYMTGLQLHSLYRHLGHTDVWGCMGAFRHIGVFRCMGAFGHMGLFRCMVVFGHMGVFRCMGDVWTYMGIWIYGRHMDLGPTDTPQT